MEIGEIWDRIDFRVDWFLAGIITLILLDLLIPLYMGWVYMTLEDFHQKYQLQPSEIFVQQAKKLENLPTMDDVEIPEPEGLKSLPKQYTRLQSTDLFLPPDATNIGPLNEGQGGGDTSPQVVQKPPIEGYQIIGRIFGRGESKASILRKTGGEGAKTSTTYVAKEGEYLENTDIRVVTISDTMVQLTSPEHRVTTFQFEVDKVSERIRDSIQIR